MVAVEDTMAYAKAWVMAIGSAVAVMVASLGETSLATMDTVEWLNAVILGLGALHVAITPNIPGARYAKAITAALLCVLVVIVNAMVEGNPLTEWPQVLVAALTALGAYATRSDATAPTP